MGTQVLVAQIPLLLAPRTDRSSSWDGERRHGGSRAAVAGPAA